MKYISCLLLLAASLLLPWSAVAQLNSFENGAYILASQPTVVQKGEIKFRQPNELVVKDAAGKKLRYSPKEVTGFRLDDAIYVAVGQFTIGDGPFSVDVAQAFALRLETGEVELLYYENPPSPYGYSPSAYLLRSKRIASIAAIRKGAFSEGKRFREAVRPFLVARPDIVKCLDEKRIDIDNLAAAISALNHNQPFNPPAALNID